MSKLPTRFVIAILAIGVLVGAATTTTVISGGLKPFNMALAQLRAPFLPQQPQAQAPLQQQPTTAAPPSGGGSFGPNCVGCVSTQNLADGAVTTPKISPGAVSLSTTQVFSSLVTVPAQAGKTDGADVQCPSGSVVTGGGIIEPTYSTDIVLVQSNRDINNGWNAIMISTNGFGGQFYVNAICTTVHP